PKNENRCGPPAPGLKVVACLSRAAVNMRYMREPACKASINGSKGDGGAGGPSAVAGQDRSLLTSVLPWPRKRLPGRREVPQREGRPGGGRRPTSLMVSKATAPPIQRSRRSGAQCRSGVQSREVHRV